MARSTARSARQLARLFAALSLATPALGSHVIVINANGGPGVDFTNLASAIAAAQNGDILLVQSPGGAVVSGKSLAIVVDVGVTGWNPLSTLEASSTSAGRPLLIQGFRSAIGASDCQGILWLDNCEVPSVTLASTAAALVLANDSAVVLTACNFVGAGGTLAPLPPSPGALASQSAVHVFDSGFRGGNWLPSATADGQGAPGMRMSGGSLYASGCGFLGGALLTQFPWLKSGDGLKLVSGAAAQALDCAFAAGAPGAALSGVPIEAAGGTFSTLPGSAHRLTCNSPVREGEVVHIQVIGQPGELAWVDVATSPAVIPLAGIGEFLLDPATVLISQPLGALPASGTQTVDVTIQPLGLEGAVLYLQPHFVDALGNVSLGSARALALLSAAY